MDVAIRQWEIVGWAAAAGDGGARVPAGPAQRVPPLARPLASCRPLAALGDCQGRCDTLSEPATVTVCGEELRCPGCGQCRALGCSGIFVIGTTTSGTADYCITSTAPVGSCSQSNLCPQGQICHLVRGECVAICRPA